jgi:hypothetical protein
MDLDKMAALDPKKVKYLVVHTEGSPSGSDGSAASINDYHRKDPKHKWSGIGYHAVIRKNGTVEAGRPLNKQGAGVLGINAISVHVCCSGNGDMADFTDAQKTALTKVLVGWSEKFPGATIEGHRALLDRLCDADQLEEKYRTSKTCPGTRVDLKAIRARVAEAKASIMKNVPPIGTPGHVS